MNFKMSKLTARVNYKLAALSKRENPHRPLSGIKIMKTILFTCTVTSANCSGNCFINLKFIIVSNL